MAIFKKTTLTLFFMMISLSISWAQDEDPAIRKRIEEYNYLFENKLFEDVIKYTYPRAVFSPELDLMHYNNFYNRPSHEVTISNVKAGKIHNSIQYKGVQYALIDYSYHLKIYSPKGLLTIEDSIGNKVDAFDYYEDLFTKRYGGENVRKDTENRTYYVIVNTKMLAIMDTTSDEWYFVEYNLKNKSGSIAFIPPKVITQLEKL